MRTRYFLFLVSRLVPTSLLHRPLELNGHLSDPLMNHLDHQHLMRSPNEREAHVDRPLTHPRVKSGQMMMWMIRLLTSPLPAPPQNPVVHHLPLHLHFLVPLPHVIHRLLNPRNPLLDGSARLSGFQSYVLRIQVRERSSFLAGNSSKLPKRRTMRNGRRTAPGGLTCAGSANSRSSLHALSKTPPRICTHILRHFI